MNVLIDILVFAIVLSALWIVALEVRFRSLKNIVAESRQLAEEAEKVAGDALSKVLNAKPKGGKR